MGIVCTHSCGPYWPALKQGSVIRRKAIMLTARVSEIKRNGNDLKVNRPVPTLSREVMDHELSVYSKDPTGGSASRY